MAQLPEQNVHDLLCNNRPKVAGASLDPCTVPGAYYVTFLMANEPGEAAAGLALIWANVESTWKIIAFAFEAP
jgi:hypothetical protein